MCKIYILLLTSMLLIGAGCSSTIKSENITRKNQNDKYSIYKKMAIVNLKSICLTEQGKVCWGLLEGECISNFIHYQNICSIDILNGYPIYPTKEQQIKLSGNIGNCVFKKRSEHNYKLDEINLKSCQDMRINFKKSFINAGSRFLKVSSSNQELQKWLSND